MHILRRPEPPIPIQTGKRVAGVGRQVGFEAEIAGHSHGGFYGIVGNHAAHDKRVVSGGAQHRSQIGSDKSTISLLGDDGFAAKRLGEWLEFITRLIWPIRRIKFDGIVTDVVNGPALPAPSRQQIANVLFCGKIVPVAVLAPDRGVDGVLQIYW